MFVAVYAFKDVIHIVGKDFFSIKKHKDQTRKPSIYYTTSQSNHKLIIDFEPSLRANFKT
jgi:hypothetical protein